MNRHLSRRRSDASLNSFEPLEGRRLLATIVVTSLADSGAGTLRQAIADANASDTIDLSGVSGTIALASTISVNKSLTFTGPGADELTIDGDDTVQLFIQSAGDVSVSGVTMKGGAGSFGGAWFSTTGTNNTSFEGVEFDSNTGSSGGAVYFANAGGTLSIDNCTFANNTALYGGAIHAGSRPLNISNSTFTQNSGNGGGGAIMSAGVLTINDSTIVNNSTSGDGGGIWYNFTSLTINRTILAANMGFSGNNLHNGQNTTINGGSNMINVAPDLDTFGDHGGPTRTYSLLSTSPAIDAGGPNDNSLDQRGFGRNGPRDIGAFEYNGVAPITNASPVWTTTSLDSAALGVPFSMTIAFTDADVGDTLAATIGGLPASFSLVDHGDGTATISGTAQMSDVGTHNVTLSGSDGTDSVDQVLSFYVGAPISYVRQGVLYVNGTDVADTIQVWLRGENSIRMKRGERIKDYAAEDVQEIRILGYGDDDQIIVNTRSIPGRIYGGDGNDTILGGPGVDRIYGDAGDDYIDAGAGKNWVYGGAGNDTLVGGNSIDRLYGQDGDDTFFGRGGRDYIDGGAGDDTAKDSEDSRIAVEILA